MTQKELRKLSGKRLLELFVEQTENANRLEQENERLKKRIADHEQHLARVGELAETVLGGGGSPDAAAAAPREAPVPREDNSGDTDQDEYRIYKVFHATVSGTGISYTLLAGKTDVPKDSHFSLKNGYVVHDGTTLENGQLTDEDIKAIAAYVDGDPPYQTVPVTSEGTEAITVDPGYYYITTAGGAVVMVGSTNPDAPAPEEAEPPAVALAVTGGGGMADENGNIMIQAGGTARFETAVDVKKGALHYRLIHTMDKRLGRRDSGMAVYIAGKDGQRSALDERYWSQSWDTAADPDHDILTVAFYEDSDHQGAVPEDVGRIIVSYDAVVGGALSDGAGISAKVAYNGKDTPDLSVRIFNAKITVSTVTEAEEDGRKTPVPLTGAGFMLGKEPVEGGGYKYYYVYDQAAGTVSWPDTPAAATAADMGADQNHAEFTGLEAGTYYLIETDVPPGHNKTDDLKIEITAGDYRPENLARRVDVVNKAGTRLPSTGGIGSSIPTGGGGFQLTLGSTSLLIISKRGKGG